MSTDRILTFGEFRLDPSSGHVYRGAATIPLTPKAFALLLYLVTHAGRLVPKAELMDAIWPGRLRRRRGAEEQHPRAAQGAGRRFQRTRGYIETAHRRGYRFMAPVVAARRHARRRPTALPKVSYARSGHVNIAYQVIGIGTGGPGLRHGVGVAPRVLLERAVVRPFPDAALRHGPPHPLRQARHRAVGSRVGERTAHARAAAGRRAGGDGGGRLRTRGAAGRVRRRTAVLAVRGHLSRPAPTR